MAHAAIIEPATPLLVLDGPVIRREDWVRLGDVHALLEAAAQIRQRAQDELDDERRRAHAEGLAAGRREGRDLWDAYTAHVLRFLDQDLRGGRHRLTVAVDASNGMAGTMVPKVFGGASGLQVIPINFDNSRGEFVHEPNPLVEANLRQVREAVVANKADLGICFDGDADRCMVVDEKGGIVGCDLLTAWLAGGALARRPGAARAQAGPGTGRNDGRGIRQIWPGGPASWSSTRS